MMMETKQRLPESSDPFSLLNSKVTGIIAFGNVQKLYKRFVSALLVFALVNLKGRVRIEILYSTLFPLPLGPQKPVKSTVPVLVRYCALLHACASFAFLIPFLVPPEN